MRKAQGLSINTIIIAAIALLVLVVLSVIFIGKIGKTRMEMDRCETAKGICVSNPSVDCGGQYDIVRYDLGCNNDGDNDFNEGAQIDGVCCIRT